MNGIDAGLRGDANDVRMRDSFDRPCRRDSGSFSSAFVLCSEKRSSAAMDGNGRSPARRSAHHANGDLAAICNRRLLIGPNVGNGFIWNDDSLVATYEQRTKQRMFVWRCMVARVRCHDLKMSSEQEARYRAGLSVGCRPLRGTRGRRHEPRCGNRAIISSRMTRRSMRGAAPCSRSWPQTNSTLRSWTEAPCARAPYRLDPHQDPISLARTVMEQSTTCC